MARDFVGEIEGVESSLELAQEMLVLPRQDFIAACSDFIQQWYFDHTDEYVEMQPQNTKSLGRERLSELKAKVRELQTGAATTIIELIDDDQLWWSLTRECVFPTKSDRPHQFNRPLRLAAGRLAPVLEEFGYLEARGPSAWRERNRRRTDVAVDVARPYFPGRLEWSEAMIDAAAEYNEVTKRCEEYLRDIEDLKEQKSRAEALELWHSV